MKYLSLACILMVSSANAGSIQLQNGNLRPTDKIDIAWTSQQGNCPTKFPIKSMNCVYSSAALTGVQAQNVDKVSKIFSTANTFSLNIDLNAATKKQRAYPFHKASCSNLQNKLGSKSVITINKRGCVIG